MMDRIKDRFLPKWSEKIFPHHFREDLLAYCPTMGLIAVVTLDEHVEIYRVANGQYAFGLKRINTKVSVDAICWKYNGKINVTIDFCYTMMSNFLSEANYLSRTAPGNCLG